MTPGELPPHLQPLYRRVLLRHAADMARAMLNHADDRRLAVDRGPLERLEHQALSELARAGDTIAGARADEARMPPEIAEPIKLHRQLTAALDALTARGPIPITMSADIWNTYAAQIVAMLDAAPPAAD